MFHIPDSLYQARNYALASVEYERIIFENPSTEVQAIAAIRRSDCLKLTGRYDEAVSGLDAVNMANLPDSLGYSVRFESALNAYLAHEPNEAFSRLESISHFYPDSARQRDVLLLKILSLNEMQHWSEADTLYRAFMLAFNKSGSQFPNPYLHFPKLKDPEKAEKLSAYLPFTGAGLFYAGSVKEGILSAVLQLGFIGFGAYSMLMERYITGALIGVGGYAAFYKGGTRRAKSLAERNNKKKTIAFNTQVRNQLMQVIKNRVH